MDSSPMLLLKTVHRLIPKSDRFGLTRFVMIPFLNECSASCVSEMIGTLVLNAFHDSQSSSIAAAADNQFSYAFKEFQANAINRIIGPSVINTEALTFAPDFQSCFMVSEMTTIINGPGRKPSIKPRAMPASKIPSMLPSANEKGSTPLPAGPQS